MPRLKIDKCFRCDLADHRLNMVLGKGTTQADILFLDESPSKEEDRKGKAMVGEVGKLFNTIILKAQEISGCKPSVYFSHILLCRPTDHFGGVNRLPSPEEILSCRENVLNIYKMIQPKITIFLGKESVRAYKKICKPFDTLTHPSMLLKQGGKVSPFYLSAVRKLADIFKRLS